MIMWYEGDSDPGDLVQWVTCADGSIAQRMEDRRWRYVTKHANDGTRSWSALKFPVTRLDRPARPKRIVSSTLADAADLVAEGDLGEFPDTAKRLLVRALLACAFEAGQAERRGRRDYRVWLELSESGTALVEMAFRLLGRDLPKQHDAED